jgi:hypothetical protein
MRWYLLQAITSQSEIQKISLANSDCISGVLSERLPGSRYPNGCTFHYERQ